MFDLELTEEQELIRDTVSSFAKEQIRPIARECDEFVISARGGVRDFSTRLHHRVEVVRRLRHVFDAVEVACNAVVRHNDESVRARKRLDVLCDVT